MVFSTSVSTGENINDETNTTVNRTENLLKILTGLKTDQLTFTRYVGVEFGTA